MASLQAQSLHSPCTTTIKAYTIALLWTIQALALKAVNREDKRSRR
jgi:hypothetical protein